MKKRIFAVVLAFAVVLSLSACGAIKPVSDDYATKTAESERDKEIEIACPLISCKVIEQDGELVHYMSGSFSQYVSEYWEKERFEKAAEIRGDSADSYFEAYARLPLISEVLPELELKWPECYLPVTFSVETREGKKARGKTSNAFNGIRLEGDVCPYTGLTVAEHETGKIYYSEFSLEDIAYLDIHFYEEADKPTINLIVMRGEKGDDHYDVAKAYYDFMATEHDGRMLCVTGYGAPSISAAAFDSDSSVVVMCTCRDGFKTDELLAFMDDNDLWGLWDMLMKV